MEDQLFETRMALAARARAEMGGGFPMDYFVGTREAREAALQRDARIVHWGYFVILPVFGGLPLLAVLFAIIGG